MNRLILLAALLLSACNTVPSASLPPLPVAITAPAVAPVVTSAVPVPAIPVLTSPTAPQLCALIVTRTAQQKTAVLDASSPACPTPESGRYVWVEVRSGGILTSSYGLHTGNTLTVASTVQLSRPDAGPIR